MDKNNAKTFVEKVNDIMENMNSLNEFANESYSTFRRNLNEVKEKMSLIEDSIGSIISLCEKKGIFSTKDLEKEMIESFNEKKVAELQIAESAGKIEKINEVTGQDSEIVLYESEGTRNYFFFKEFSETIKPNLVGKKIDDVVLAKKDDKEVEVKILGLYKLSEVNLHEESK